MFVEFLGMPGVGKTTTLPGVVSSLGNLGVASEHLPGGSREPDDLLEASRPVRNLRRVLRLATVPRLTLAALVRITSRAQASELLRLANRQMSRRDLERAAGGVILLDEGPLHKVCMLYADNKVRHPLELARSVSHPDLCIVLELELDDVVHRIRERRVSSPVDRLSDDDLVHYLVRYKRAEGFLTRHLSCPVARVEVVGADVSSRIATCIAAHL